MSELSEGLPPAVEPLTLADVSERVDRLGKRLDELVILQTSRPWFSDTTWHALTNPANLVNALSVVAGVIPFIAGNEAVKANAPEIAIGLLTFNGVVTSVLSWYRDKNNPPPTVYQNPELKPGAK